MAFNPFETFRKRSKAIFAVLGIVVMLTFVLSAGTGGTTDFFTQIGNSFSGGRGSPRVAEVYGDDVTRADLDELARQRRAANAFMTAAEDAAYVNHAAEIEKDIRAERLTKETRDALNRFIFLKVDAGKPAASDAPEALKARADAARAYGEYLQQMMQGLPAQQLARARQAAKPDSDDAKALEAAQNMVFHDLFGGRGQDFFRIVPGDSVKDLLDYDLLLKKADKLGIDYSPDTIKELVAKDTQGRLTRQDNGRIEQRLRKSGQFPNFSGDWLVQAIGNEYRARAALVTMRGNAGSGGGPFAKGESATMSAGPGAVTPYEFYQFYRDRCREVNYTLFEIPATALVSQVAEEPSVKDRNQFFMKYRTEEADPAKDAPGFKESRKVKVDFVTVDAKAPRVANGVPAVTAASIFLSSVAGPMSIGANGIPALAQIAHPALAASLPKMEALAAKQRDALLAANVTDAYFFRPREASIYRPAPITALLGGLAGQDVSAMMAALSLGVRDMEIHHLRTFTPMVLQAWAAPFNPTPSNAFGWPAMSYSMLPKPLPDAAYEGEIRATLSKRQLRTLFDKDTDEFKNRMLEAARDVFGPAPDKTKADAAKAAATKFAAEWAAARGLTVTGTKEPVSKTSILTEPALKPLVEAAAKEPGQDPANNALVKKFFDAFQQQDPRLPPMMQTMAFDPEFFPTARPFGAELDQPLHLVWLSDEVPPVAYTSLADADAKTGGEMTKRVDAAWKLDKAKALAAKEAAALAEKVATIAKTVESNKPGVEKQFAELPWKQIPVTGLAKLKFQHGATQASMGYEPGKLTKEQVANPTDDFVDNLLDLRNKPLGTTIVLNDKAKSKYYVAVSTAKSERTLEQFRDVFNKSNAIGGGKNPLYDQYALSEERRTDFQDALTRLRAEAKVTENEAYFKSLKRDAESE